MLGCWSCKGEAPRRDRGGCGQTVFETFGQMGGCCIMSILFFFFFFGVWGIEKGDG